MKLIYITKIEMVGESAEEFLAHDMFITFKKNAPKELEDYCYMHSENNLTDKIKTGDILLINENEYRITAVGDIVNLNLEELGHITYKFTGEEDAKVSGTLYLEKKQIAPIGVGTIIKVIRN